MFQNFPSMKKIKTIPSSTFCQKFKFYALDRFSPFRLAAAMELVILYKAPEQSSSSSLRFMKAAYCSAAVCVFFRLADCDWVLAEQEKPLPIMTFYYFNFLISYTFWVNMLMWNQPSCTFANLATSLALMTVTSSRSFIFIFLFFGGIVGTLHIFTKSKKFPSLFLLMSDKWNRKTEEMRETRHETVCCCNCCTKSICHCYIIIENLVVV